VEYTLAVPTYRTSFRHHIAIIMAAWWVCQCPIFALAGSLSWPDQAASEVLVTSTFFALSLYLSHKYSSHKHLKPAHQL
jgi:hypothetical protein